MIEAASAAQRTLVWQRTSALLWARVTVAVASALSATYWTAIAAQRWRDFETNAFDLGFFDQVVWNTAHGRVFETTFVPYNFAGQHFEPVLLLFAPAYRLGAGPLLLTVTQAVAASSAAMLLFEAARRFGLRPPIAAAGSIAYLLSPYLHAALLFDFHPEVMVALPAFCALWAAAAGRPVLATLTAGSALLFKEDALFVVLSLAAVIAVYGYRRHASFLVVAALAWSVLLLSVLMPLLRDGRPSDLAMRYSPLLGGREGAAGLAWAATHPLMVIGMLIDPSGLGSLARFLASSAPLAVAASWGLLPLVLAGLAAVFSTHPPQQALQLHYAAELVPVAAIATMMGARRLAHASWPPGILTAALLLPALIGFVARSPVSPLAGTSHTAPTETHRFAVHYALSLVPPDAPVSAQSGLLPRLSQRREAFEFPRAATEADWVLIDRLGHRSAQSVDAGYDHALATVRRQHERVFALDGVEVFRARGR
jgi:uncharacterized membrane protein